MKMKHTKLLLAFALVPFSAASAEQVVQIHPLFDSGRVATRDLATTDFAQWTNGVGATRANNVGWNEQRGIWYSFIRFAGTRAEGQQVFGLSLADWHAALTAAGSVTLRGDVNWHEVNPDFPVEPGVRVSVWLIPGLEIPEGALPSFANTWPWNYAHSTKVMSFGPEDVTPLHASWGDAEFDPTNTRDKMAYELEIDLTEAIKAALAAGQMTPTTPWGIVFFPEAMEDQLNVPNNPQWLTRQQTVLHGGFWEVVIAEGTDPVPSTWAGFPLDEDGWVDTGDFMGMLNVVGDFVYSFSLDQWLYLPESAVFESGAWTYVYR